MSKNSFAGGRAAGLGVRGVSALALVGSSLVGGVAHAQTEVNLPQGGPATASCPAYRHLGTPGVVGQAIALPPSEAEFSRQMLQIHNNARRAVSTDTRQWVRTSDPLPDLQWDARLADGARAYAQTRAEANNINHGTYESRNGAGENLSGSGAWSTATSVEGLAQAWVREGEYYNGAVAPNTSCRTGISVGHWTQIVWRNTTHVGCGVGESGNVRVLACWYRAAGNTEGQHPYNPTSAASSGGSTPPANGATTPPPPAAQTTDTVSATDFQTAATQASRAVRPALQWSSALATEAQTMVNGWNNTLPTSLTPGWVYMNSSASGGAFPDPLAMMTDKYRDAGQQGIVNLAANNTFGCATAVKVVDGMRRRLIACVYR